MNFYFLDFNYFRQFFVFFIIICYKNVNDASIYKIKAVF